MVYAPRLERSPGKDVAKTGLYQGLGLNPGEPDDAAASPMRGLLPLWVGIGVYALFCLPETGC